MTTKQAFLEGLANALADEAIAGVDDTSEKILSLTPEDIAELTRLFQLDLEARYA